MIYKNKSKCMYCNLEAYGPGCIYSPHKKHVHVDDPKRCVYCGSVNYGPGCVYNPFSKVHIHGVEYNQMLKDSTLNGVTTAYLIKKLSQSPKESLAYKLGLINEDGHMIRKPETQIEKNALSPIDVYVYKLRRFLGSKLDVLHAEVTLEAVNEKCAHQDTVEIYQKELALKHSLSHLSKQMFSLISTARESGLPLNVIEHCIVESFSTSKDSQS